MLLVHTAVALGMEAMQVVHAMHKVFDVRTPCRLAPVARSLGVPEKIVSSGEV